MVIYVIQGVLAHLGLELQGQRVVVQGFGNVGSAVAAGLHSLGARVVAVSDLHGGVVNPGGLDIEAVNQWRAERRLLCDCPLGEPVGRRGVLEVPCEILVPAALERQITRENARNIDCRFLVEAANGPTTPEADDILADSDVTVAPDVLANAGGVTMSYFEWVQDQQKYLWETTDLGRRLRIQMHTALARVLDAAERLGVGCERRR